MVWHVPPHLKNLPPHRFVCHPHQLAPYTGRPRIMKAPARTKECAHGQKVPEEARTNIKQVASNRRLKKMLSLLLKRAPLAGRAPHRLINAPREV